MQDESVNVAEELGTRISGLRRPGLAAAHGLPRRRREAPRVRRVQEVLRVGAQGEWFLRNQGEEVSLKTRRSLRRILAHLVKMHRTRPGQPRSVRQLQAAGWPGERMLAKSGADRVYTAVRTLRRFGLEGLLITRNGGYMLHPELEILGD